MTIRLRQAAALARGLPVLLALATLQGQQPPPPAQTQPAQQPVTVPGAFNFSNAIPKF